MICFPHFFSMSNTTILRSCMTIFQGSFSCWPHNSASCFWYNPCQRNRLDCLEHHINLSCTLIWSPVASWSDKIQHPPLSSPRCLERKSALSLICANSKMQTCSQGGFAIRSVLVRSYHWQPQMYYCISENRCHWSSVNHCDTQICKLCRL